MMKIEDRLAELGLSLPEVPAPVAAYVPAVRAGNWVYVSGQTPFRDGKLRVKGKVGKDVTLEDAYEEAKQCALNIMAAVKSVAGSLDNVERIVKLVGFVASTPDFTDAPKVVNGASELFVQVFGDKGKHARSAVGVASLPLDCCVEVEAVVLLKE
ncbi:MAG: RidA family protein [Firmicutes bacterium]|nr:RidA family protein [Candidatus Fermentithermobacillaceae bacterium]HON86941.1 RidA family protein [Bacillota bacterium]HOV66022.1 RidA family protein [Bacillota bacterium]HRC54137.1 RidA family protein [Bacillota bacterium]